MLSWPAGPLPVSGPGDRAVVAAAIAHPRESPATRARIARGDQLEVGRELAAIARAGDHDAPLLEHLPQRLEAAPLELRQLVEEQHAAVSE